MKVSDFIFRTELDRKRWARFVQNKRYLFSLYIFFGLCLMSVGAEFLANNKPILFSHQGQLYFPAVVTYHPSDFELPGVHMDYRQNKELMDWAVWPLVSWGPLESDLTLSSFPSAPDEQHLMGTDSSGRDVLSRLIYGFRYSIAFALLSWLLSYFLGIILGSMMGFLGGRVDMVGLRFVEILEAVPILLLLLTVISIFQPSLLFLILINAALGWMGIAIYMRAEFLKLRRREFVEGARALGASRGRQIFTHILPNSLTPIITFSPFAVAGECRPWPF